MAGLLAPVASFFRRRKREQALALAATWPQATAKLLKSTVIEKDALAEGRHRLSGSSLIPTFVSLCVFPELHL